MHFEDGQKTKEQLMNKLVALHQWVAGLEALEAKRKQAEELFGSLVISLRPRLEYHSGKGRSAWVPLTA